MEFKSLKNIETSFRQIRLFTLVFLGLCAVVAVFSVVKSYQFAQRQREKIYVLDQGKSLMLALSQDLSQNRPVGFVAPWRRGTRSAASTSSSSRWRPTGRPSRATSTAPCSYATRAPTTTRRIFRRRVTTTAWWRATSISRCGSIRWSATSTPYRVTTYAREMIIRESNVTERSLITRCNLINSVRSDNNPQGFTMERFEIVENRDLRVIAR